MRPNITASLTLLSLFLCNCTRLPQPQATRAPGVLIIPSHFDAPRAPVPNVADGLLALFDDPRIDHYVAQALAGHPDLQLSLARLEEAGFNARKTSASLLPSLNATLSAARSRNQAGSGTATRSSYAASLDAQWEVDLWGRIRSGVLAARQNQAATAADYAAARQSIAAQTMQACFALIAAEQLLELTQRRLNSFASSVELVRRRFEAGIGNLGDLDLALTDVETSRAQLEQRREARDQAARQLTALTGTYPNATASLSTWPSLQRSFPSTLPSDVMLHRPDLHAAYLRLLAADSSVKMAHRDLFPRLTLTGSTGQQAQALGDLLDTDFSVGSFAAGLVAPLLDGGNRRAELGAAEARAKQALASYHRAVLNAFREVEDALGSEHYLQRQQEFFARALEAARSAETRTQRNYENGLVEILSLLEAQRRSFSAEEQLINTRTLRYQNRVSLALALGKGY